MLMMSSLSGLRINQSISCDGIHNFFFFRRMKAIDHNEQSPGFIATDLIHRSVFRQFGFDLADN